EFRSLLHALDHDSLAVDEVDHLVGHGGRDPQGGEQNVAGDCDTHSAVDRDASPAAIGSHPGTPHGEDSWHLPGGVLTIVTPFGQEVNPFSTEVYGDPEGQATGIVVAAADDAGY